MDHRPLDWLVVRLCKTKNGDMVAEARVAAQVRKYLRVHFDDLTGDGRLTLEHANCLGDAQPGPSGSGQRPGAHQRHPVEGPRHPGGLTEAVLAARGARDGGLRLRTTHTKTLTFASIQPGTGLRAAQGKGRADLRFGPFMLLSGPRGKSGGLELIKKCG